jgi:hypothetical protein
MKMFSQTPQRRYGVLWATVVRGPDTNEAPA